MCAALVFAGLDWTRKNVEVVTLHVSGGYTDHYPRVFIVDEPPAVWVRAERPDRLWLDVAAVEPGGRGAPRRTATSPITHRCGTATAITSASIELFRAKYGVFDRVAAWIWRRNAVPIRLEPRGELATGF